MLKFCSLFSGSSGNSFFITDGKTNILIDSGVSSKKITNVLQTMHIDNIDAILVTHEHTDHVSGLSVLSSKLNVPVYANNKTWDAMKREKDKIKNQKTFNISEAFEIGSLKIFPFLLPHDAAAPCGFNIFDGKEKLSIATDLGHVDNKTFDHFLGSSSILLEANYDSEILKVSSYPYLLKQRISSPFGHLSNDMAGNTISKLVDSGLKNALLVHLSKENNFSELVYKTIEEKLNEKNHSTEHISINIAPRTEPSSMFG